MKPESSEKKQCKNLKISVYILTNRRWFQIKFLCVSQGENKKIYIGVHGRIMFNTCKINLRFLYCFNKSKINRFNINSFYSSSVSIAIDYLTTVFI